MATLVKAPSTNNDGMGSLLYPGDVCRFRVWAPFAKSVQVMGEFTDWLTSPIGLEPEGNGNWSGEISGVTDYQMYQYRIENVGGPGNDNSQIWNRTDARAMQVVNSNATSAGYVVPAFDQSGRPPFTPPAFEDYILYQLHIGSFAGLNDQPPLTINNHTATFQQIESKLGYIKGLGFNAIALLPIGDVHDDLGLAGTG
jgi:1,4-alpha-glucan branching enzyme